MIFYKVCMTDNPHVHYKNPESIWDAIPKEILDSNEEITVLIWENYNPITTANWNWYFKERKENGNLPYPNISFCIVNDYIWFNTKGILLQ